MKTTIIAVPLEDGSQIEGSAKLSEYLKQNDITYDTDVFFAKAETARKTVYNCCRKTKQAVLDCLEKKQFPLIIGGDHAVSIGSVSAIIQKHDVSIVWIDAHTDINTPEASITKRIHGMPLATLMKNGYPELSALTEDKAIRNEDIVFLGPRSMDPYEKEYLSINDMHAYDDIYIKKHSIQKVLEEVKGIIKKPIHISLDLDVFDPQHCPGVNTPVENGLSIDEVKVMLNYLFDNFTVISMDLVEYNPLKDVDNKTVDIIKRIIRLIKEKVNNF